MSSCKSLNVRLFDSRWESFSGVQVCTPLGGPHQGHVDFIESPKAAVPSGFYAVVRESPEGVSAAVDRIRSLPLFYGQSCDGKLWLSDRADWVREGIRADTVLRGARNDFLLAGYVTGRHTLFDRVLQLQAGERLDARVGPGGLGVVVSDHSLFRRTYDNEAGDGELELDLGCAIGSVMERLVALAGDRQIVVPLSGGNDSRVIALYLAKLCPDQVVTFAYGRPSLGEVAISQSVAEALGLEWHFVEGAPDFWARIRRSHNAAVKSITGHQYSSAPYMQDWPALSQLIEEGKVSRDSVVVPGHSGDVPTGGMILPELLLPDSSVEDTIRQFHYSLWPYNVASTGPEELNEWIRTTSLPGAWTQDSGILSAVSAGDAWNWRERQAKWLVNSMRGVEALGATWWLPLWDGDFVDFWMRIPLDGLRERRLYRQFVRNEFFAFTGLDVPNFEHRVSGQARRVSLGRRLVPYKWRPVVQKVYREIVPRSPGFGEMGWEAWVEPELLSAFGTRARNITSFAALETLLSLSSDYPGLLPEVFEEGLKGSGR